MNSAECDCLDGYLSGWLSGDEAARFRAHLAECPDCTRKIDDERRIDRLLAQGAAKLQPVPPALIGRIEDEIRSMRRRRVIRWAFGLSTAVAVALAAAVWLTLQTGRLAPGPKPIVQKPTEAENGEHDAASPARPASEGEARARVTLADRTEGIVVPLETSNPNVSIVLIYPTVKPVRDRRGPASPSP